MATAPTRSPRTPRLYLVTAPLSDTAALADALPAAIAAADVAAILLRLEPGDERTQIDRIKTLAGPVQQLGVALLVAGDPDLAARGGADGVHLADPDALKTALSRLKPERIAGVGGLHSRHDAMVAGEAGADYVMFGEPDAHGRRPSFTAITERVAWWSQLIEIPCVAWAERIEEIGDLCAAGADFIALGDAVFADPRGLAVAVNDARARLTAASPA
jgi:thiamine-phosphate pyrophosphorylase